jgi:hypothetical protein
VTIDPRGTGGELIVPLLVLRPLERLSIAAASGTVQSAVALREAPPHARFVGLVDGATGTPVEFGVAISSALIMTIPVAWELFDELRLQQLQALDAQSIACLLAAGTVLVDSAGQSARYDIAGPAGALEAVEAYTALAALDTGMPASNRRMLLLAGVIFVILATGCALLVRRRAAIVAMAALVLIAAATFAAWRQRLPAVAEHQGTIVIAQGEREQHDRWTFATATRATQVDIALTDTLRPMLIDAAHAQSVGLRLHLANAARSPQFQCTLVKGMAMGFVSRRVVPRRPTVRTDQNPVDSPLLTLARSMYGSDAGTVRQMPPSRQGDWPTLIIQRP